MLIFPAVGTTCPPGGLWDEPSQEQGFPTCHWLSAHPLTHARAPVHPRTHAQNLLSVTRAGQRGLQRRAAFLYVLQKCQVFPLQLLLNIGLKTLVGSSERLGLSTGCRSSSALRISDSLMRQLLGQKSTICKM